MERREMPRSLPPSVDIWSMWSQTGCTETGRSCGRLRVHSDGEGCLTVGLNGDDVATTIGEAMQAVEVLPIALTYAGFVTWWYVYFL
jgi:hypothetical protein